MSQRLVFQAVVIGVACSITFVAGYVFRATYGGDKQPIIDAIVASQTTPRVIDSLAGIRSNIDTYEELSAAKSMQEVQLVKEKYRKAALKHIESFQRQAAAADSERQRAIFAPFVADLPNYKRKLGENL